MSVEQDTTPIKNLNRKEPNFLEEESKLLKEENLTSTCLDLSLPEDIRLKSMDKLYVVKGKDETSELVNKLSSMYQFSGLHLLRSYLHDICVKTNVHPFLKVLLIKSLCVYDEKDEIGYKALDTIYPSIGIDVATPIKVEMVVTLMKCKKYKNNAKVYFFSIINDQELEIDYRYKTILNLENLLNDKKTKKYFLQESCS